MKKSLRTVLLFLFLCLSGISLYFTVKLNYIRKEKINLSNLINIVGKSPDNVVWKEYNNSQMGFSMLYPPSLTEKDLGPGATYINFIRFEENEKSTEKGMAIGIVESGLTEEADRIKKDFENQGNAILVEQKKVKVDGVNGVWLYYKPEKVDGSEERIVVIFSRGNYAFSVSTVPEQMDKVLDGFKFND